MSRRRRRLSGCGRDRYDGGGDRTGREPGCSGWRRHCVCDGGLLGQLCGGDDFGSDGAGSATYSLVLTGSNVASGLFALDAADTTAGDGDGIGQGAQIVLNQSGNDHHRLGGRHQLLHDHAEPGDRSGDVHAARQHLARRAPATTTITATLTLANANAAALVQTVTDADGDIDTAAINLGAGVFQIEDDGPDAVVVNAAAAAIVLDETRPVGHGDGRRQRAGGS